MASPIHGTIAASAAITANTTTNVPSKVGNGGALRLAVVVDVTAVTGTTPTLDIVVEGQDPASGKWVNLATFTQITAATTAVKFIGDGVASGFPMKTMRVRETVGGTTPSFTRSLGYFAHLP